MGYVKRWIEAVAEDYDNGLTISQLVEKYHQPEENIVMAITINAEYTENDEETKDNKK